MTTVMRRLATTFFIGAAVLDLSTAIAAEQQSTEQRLQALTLDEKLDLLGGAGFSTTAIPRLQIPALRMSDGPAGVRSPSPSTAYAGGIAVAASWDTELAGEIGLQMGRDARARGVRFVLAPGVNISRSPLNGRNFEYYGEDPLLGSRLAVQFIRGMQSQNVSATIKHFAANNSEFARHASNSVVDDRALREIYLPIFESAVKEADVGSVMSSYNLVNGKWAAESPQLVRILKQDWGFRGVYMSDWGATHDGVASAQAGLDLEMPSGAQMNREALQRAIKEGAISAAQIDDKVRRLLSVADRFHWFTDVERDLSIPLFNQAGRAVAARSARESIVLLKNQDNLLPLDPHSVKRLAVIGPNAHPAIVTGGGSGRVFGFAPVSVLQGVSQRLENPAQVTYASGIRSLKALALTTRFTLDPDTKARGVRVETFADESLSGPPTTQRIEPRFATGVAGFGTELFEAIDELPGEEVLAQLGEQMGKPPTFERWSANLTPERGGTHTVFVQCSVRYRLLIDGRVVIDSSRTPRAALRQVHLDLDARSHSVVLEQLGGPELGKPFWRVGIVHDDSFVDPAAVELAKNADAVVLAVGFNSEIESEALDREFILPPGQVELINAVAAANKRVIVVLNSGGSVDLSSWLHGVPALLAAWFPGQEGGTAVAQILFGDASPSGHLPISWERRLEDNPSNDSYFFNDAVHLHRVNYREGVFVGYRGMQRANLQPAFPFGYGLSYAAFLYGNVKVAPAAGRGNRAGTAFEVSFDITNTGARSAADVAQVYIAPQSPRVPRPIRELKGFARVELAPGATQRATVMLDARAFAYFDTSRQRWQVDAGRYAVELGQSVDDIRETVQIDIKRSTSLSVAD